MDNNSEFIRSLENATLAMVREVARNMDKACLLVEREAKKNCPVDQGILRASMFSKTEVSAAAITGTVANNSEYAPYVHQGTGIYAADGNGRRTPWRYRARGGRYDGWHVTRGQRPNPFLQKARDENRAKISRILGGDGNA